MSMIYSEQPFHPDIDYYAEAVREFFVDDLMEQVDAGLRSAGLEKAK